MQDQLTHIIKTAIEQQNVLLEEPIDLSKGEHSPLYGENGQIDSLTLVSILVDMEAMLTKDLGIEVRLADTSDLPPTATPFATFGSLRAHAQGCCEAMLTAKQV